MSNKKLAILGIIAAVTLLWAIIQSKISNRTRTVLTGQTYLISGIDLEDIASISVKSDDNTIVFVRGKTGAFYLGNKDNYPVDVVKSNELIANCLDIQVPKQFITDNPKNHEDLGVVEDKAQTVVEFLKADASTLMKLFVGNTKENGQGTYVRVSSSDKVYEAIETPWFDSEPVNYLKTQLVALIPSEIEMVTVVSPLGKYVLKEDSDSKNVILANIPDDKKLKQSEADSVFEALSSLNFNDVMKNPGDLDFDRQYICRIHNSTEFTFDIASKDDKTYIKCSAEFTGEVPEAAIDDTDEQLKEKEEKLALYVKADDFSERHKGWVYEIPQYKAELLAKELIDLVEDKEIVEEVEIPDANDIMNEILSGELPSGS